MHVIEEIVHRVESAGMEGVRKAELKKEFGKECDGILERLAREERVFVEKKGVPYFVWSRENYIMYISERDPKFKLMLNMVVGLGHSVARIKEHTQNIREEMERLSVQEGPDWDSDFEGVFDRCLREAGTSIGWTPFAKIRERICQTSEISKEKFYMLAGDLVERNHGKYEISSGGHEGIVVRGMVHGFVRNV